MLVVPVLLPVVELLLLLVLPMLPLSELEPVDDELVVLPEVPDPDMFPDPDELVLRAALFFDFFEDFLLCVPDWSLVVVPVVRSLSIVDEPLCMVVPELELVVEEFELPLLLLCADAAVTASMDTNMITNFFMIIKFRYVTRSKLG